MSTMKNGDVMFFAAIAIALIVMWAFMRKSQNVTIRNTPAPLPSGLYTSGNASNGMDTRLRKNFQMQPNGGPTTG